MIHDHRKNGRLIALFIAGLVLFNYPILSLFNRNLIGSRGSTTLFLYFFRLVSDYRTYHHRHQLPRCRPPRASSDEYRD